MSSSIRAASGRPRGARGPASCWPSCWGVSWWGPGLAALALCGPARGEPVISEVRQAQAEFVEVYNPGPESANLGGYRLIGDVSFTFPAGARLAAGACLVLAEGPEPFHSEFPQVEVFAPLWERMRDRGGELMLHDAAGREVDRVRYGPVEPGKSWQRRDARTAYRGPENWASAAPTPGRPGEGLGELPSLCLDLPTLPEEPGAGPIPISVRVHGRAERVFARWKLDEGPWQELALLPGAGAEAGRQGVYRGAIPPQRGPALLRVELVAGAGETQVALKQVPWGGRLRAFVRGEEQSVLPLYFLSMRAEDRATLLGEPGRTQLPATLVVVADGRTQIVGRVTVNVRGSAWTRSWPKRSWTLRFLQPGPGPLAPRGVILRSPHNDVSYLREELSHDLFRRAGVPCPRARLVRVHLNGERYGLSIAIEPTDEVFLTRSGLAGGALYKAQVTRTPEEWCDGRSYPNAAWYAAAWGKATRTDEPYAELQRFIEGYTACPPEQLEAYFARELDVERYLRYLAVCALISHWDSLVKNYYWCRDVEGSGKWVVIPWDLDLTWGEYFVDKDTLPVDLPVVQGTKEAEVGGPYRWWNRMRDRFLSVPAHRRRLYLTIQELLSSEFAVQPLAARIMSLAKARWPEVLADRQRWGTYRGDRQPSAPFQPEHFFRGLNALRLYAQERRRFLSETCARELLALPPAPAERTTSEVAALQEGLKTRRALDAGALGLLLLLVFAYRQAGGTRA
ncbi:MAG: CotH kinase family protein [Planctomycetota bacterium]